MDNFDMCAELFREGVNSLHTGLYEIQWGAGQIVADKTYFGKGQVEKGVALARLGVCTIEKAVMAGCVPDEEMYYLERGFADIKTGTAGLEAGIYSIPEFSTDDSNKWLGSMIEILSGMLKVGNGHNIVMDIWGRVMANSVAKPADPPVCSQKNLHQNE
ncbi:MAG: hypothetical protein LBE35_07310 [Clostridiales bacterium]|jgi:hypothetical protein|nr:hypothetical protein [Clostridiales bacterium]